MRLEDAALLFATQKHIGQTRKFNNLPYIVHPIRVASLVAKQLENTSHKEEVISSVVAAAYLHDTLEDTETTVEELTREFSPAIASLVQELTVPAEIDNGYQKKQVLNSELQVVSDFNFCREYKRSQKVGYLYGF